MSQIRIHFINLIYLKRIHLNLKDLILISLYAQLS